MKIRIIPAIDLIDGHCVRLSMGDYNIRKEYSADPVDMAKSFEDSGLAQLHIVDLDGARASYPSNLAVLEKIASSTGMVIEWGGGLKSAEALESCFNAGASMAIIGSLAVDSPNLMCEWMNCFSPEKIVLGADVRQGKVATHGWLKDSGMELDTLVELFIGNGLRRMICTDISCDGMLCGPNFQLYSHLKEKFGSIETTVSGGVSSIADIEKASEMGLGSIIVGKALYEGRIKLKDLQKWLLNA